MTSVDIKFGKFQKKYFDEKLMKESEIMFQSMRNGRKFCGLMNLPKYKKDFLLKAINYNIKLLKAENEKELMEQVIYLCNTPKFKCGDLKKIKDLDLRVKMCVLECLKNHESLHNFNVDEMRLVNNMYKLILGTYGKEQETTLSNNA